MFKRKICEMSLGEEQTEMYRAEPICLPRLARCEQMLPLTITFSNFTWIFWFLSLRRNWLDAGSHRKIHTWLQTTLKESRKIKLDWWKFEQNLTNNKWVMNFDRKTCDYTILAISLLKIERQLLWLVFNYSV